MHCVCEHKGIKAGMQAYVSHSRMYKVFIFTAKTVWVRL